MTARPRAKKFARAALAVATELGAIEDLLERFDYLAQVYRANKAFRQLMITRRIPLDRKMEALHQIFQDNLTALEYELLHMLLKQNLGSQLPEVTRSLLTQAQAKYARLDLTVTTPQPLSSQELQALGDRVGQGLGRKLHVKAVTDRRLLGGIRLRLGNILVDGSISRRLELLRAGLL